jgi:predicted nucleic acid-binding protein
MTPSRLMPLLAYPAAGARGWSARLERPPVCPEMTRVEVLRGVRSDERRATERLFGTVDWIGVDEPIARRAGELGRIWRRSHQGIATADLIIAATAADFPMIKRLKAPYHP